DVMHTLACGDFRDDAFRVIVAAYTYPDRHYHTLEHLAEMFAVLAPWKSRVDWPAVCLATWYHDVIYDSRRGGNEAESADVAAAAMAQLGVPGSLSTRVQELIQMTQSHEASECDQDAWLFLDADLAILAAPETSYRAYSLAVRREYAWVEEDAFLRG